MTAKAENAKKIDHSLRTRVRSAFILGMIVLSMLYVGGIPFGLMMAAATAIGVYEWGKMVRNERMRYRLIFMYFGMLYIGLSCGLMIWLRTGTTYGLYNMLTLFAIVWASDISAYFAGKAIGGPKLAPTISPKKTWAGFFGSSVGAAIVCAGLACPALIEPYDISTVGNFSPFGYAVMGFVLAMVGQAGDLFISVMKRRYGVKDTGTLIPGHGGILDRIDALLLVALAFAMIVMHVG